MNASVNKLEEKILNSYQRDFPLEPRPYDRMAGELGITEDELLAVLSALQERQIISRVGAVVKPQTVGASTLAAMRVPKNRLSKVADIVSRFDAVNHNYERENDLNLWFVVTAPDQDGVKAVLKDIETQTGIKVIDLPLLTSFHIDLGFDLK
jgi:DNA-binding Lrp family transcriptional regulator